MAEHTLPRILLLESDDWVGQYLEGVLRSEEFQLIRIAASDDPLATVERLDPAIVLLGMDNNPKEKLLSLSRILMKSPRPVLVVSTQPDSRRDALARALELGAVDVLPIPPAGPASVASLQRDRMSRQIAAAARIRVNPIPLTHAVSSLGRPREHAPDKSSDAPTPAIRVQRFQAVGLAVSTGGPQALTRLFPSIPGGFPVPIFVVQHIIHGFLPRVVQRLNDLCPLEVRIAENGDLVSPGVVYFAPDSRHLIIERDDSGVPHIRLSLEPSHLLHCPSADVLFASLARTYGAGVLAVIMTGMGQDGVIGLRDIKIAGGYAIAQDRLSSAIYGMARVAEEEKLLDKIVPLDHISATVIRLISRRPAPPAD